MVLNAADILTEVKRRADSSNHMVQLFSIDLYKKMYFKKRHFSGECNYSNLHRERHRIKKSIERWQDVYEKYTTTDFNADSRIKHLDYKIEELRKERKIERDSFVYDFLSTY